MIQENLVQFDWTSLKVMMILLLAAATISLAIGVYALYRLLIRKGPNADLNGIRGDKDK